MRERRQPTRPERWAPLRGNEASYEISTHGRLRSLDRTLAPQINRWGKSISRVVKGQMMKPKPDKNGYLHVNIRSHHTVCVHRMVAETFIPNPEGLPEINHDDGFEDNNIDENLVWVTTEQNANHAIEVLGRVTKGAPGKRVILDDGEWATIFISASAAARALGVNRSNVHNALLRDGRCHGFEVRYG